MAVAPVLDLVRAKTATEQEIRDALTYEPPPKPEPPAPKLSTYRTLDREPGDSFLDFECGARTDKPIRVGPRWTVFAFHNPASRVVGRIRVSLDLSQFTGRSLDLKIFDAFGGSLFDGRLTENEIRFDQVRIPSGDTLIVFRAPNGATGTGVCNLPHSRLLEDELPAVPSLNSPILEPQTDTPIGECAVPTFEFSSR